MDIFLLIVRILLVVVIIIIGITLLIKLSKRKSTNNSFIDEFINRGYKVFKSDNNNYDNIVTKDDKKYLVRYFKVPNNAEVSINNPSLIEVKYGGSSDPGKAQPFNRFHNELGALMNMKVEDAVKVIIVYPNPKKIVQWINENEIILVDKKTKVYGNYFITSKDFDFFN